MSTHPAIELQTEDVVLRLDDRVLEAFGRNSSFNVRYHVDSVGFAARDPDEHGKVKVLVGRMQDGELCLGSERIRLDLDPVAWARFQAFVAAVKRVQAAGPEAW